MARLTERGVAGAARPDDRDLQGVPRRGLRPLAAAARRPDASGRPTGSWPRPSRSWPGSTATGSSRRGRSSASTTRTCCSSTTRGSPIELRLFVMFMEHRMKAFQGAFHDSPDHALWYGWSEMQRDLVEIRGRRRRERDAALESRRDRHPEADRGRAGRAPGALRRGHAGHAGALRRHPAGRGAEEPPRHAAGPARPERPRAAGRCSTAPTAGRLHRALGAPHRRGGGGAAALRLGRLPGAAAGRGRVRLPLRHRLEPARHALGGGPLRDPGRAGAPDAGRDPRHVPRRRRLLDQPAARGGAQARRDAGAPGRRRAAAHRARRPGAGGDAAALGLEGRQVGAGAWSSCPTTGAATGRSAATPTRPGRGGTTGTGEAPRRRYFLAKRRKKPTTCAAASFQSMVSGMSPSSGPSTQMPPQDSQVS